MVDRTRILVIAATARELATPDGWRAALCGVGPVDAAAATTRLIAEHQPAAVLHVGIAGARRSLGLSPASLVIGESALYCDHGISIEWAPNLVVAPQDLVAAAQRAVPQAIVARIGTSARIGGGRDCDVEAMEGFAVLRAAALAGLPAIEVRAISNEVEEADRARWHFDAAFAAITGATPALVDELARCVS